MAFAAVPWRATRVLEHDHDVLVVDKPPGIVVHGGDEALGDDVVGRLRAWLEGRGEDGYLGVHQRLDKDASGVLFFTRRRELNAAVARDMEATRCGASIWPAWWLGGLRTKACSSTSWSTPAASRGS
ncbi:MAG: pseudouridine synthase [Polyangiaceae bacterium]